MERFICENVFVPLRSGPSHKAEMLSQLLFGEKYRILDQKGHWMKVENLFDNYQGWLDMDHLQHSEDRNSTTGLVLNRSLLCYKQDKTKLVLEAGCEIYDPDFRSKTFSAGKNSYTSINEFSNNYITTKESFPDTALKFINSPYIWGGRVPSGIDCSGLTQLVYKIHGVRIPRDSRQQVEIGEAVNFIDETKPGDLVFFDDEQGSISHVGMIFSHGLIIHASGRVRIDPVDHQGIFKQEFNRYTHHLRTIRRIIS